LADGRSTLDLYGRGFVLLRLGTGAPAGEGLQRAARERGVPFAVVAIEAPEVLQAYQRRLVLVRPDGHLAWGAAPGPADAGAMIERVGGKLALGGAPAIGIAS